jgi:hypothetical protein
MIKRMPKKTIIAMAIPKGSSLKICSIYPSIPILTSFYQPHPASTKIQINRILELRLLISLVSFVFLVYLVNQTDQINQRDQINQ